MIKTEMKVKIVENKGNKLRLEIENGSHESLILIEEEVLEDKDVNFCSYKREHPLLKKYSFLIITKKKDAKTVFNTAVMNVSKKVNLLKKNLIKSI